MFLGGCPRTGCTGGIESGSFDEERTHPLPLTGSSMKSDPLYSGLLHGKNGQLSPMKRRRTGRTVSARPLSIVLHFQAGALERNTLEALDPVPSSHTRRDRGKYSRRIPRCGSAWVVRMRTKPESTSSITNLPLLKTGGRFQYSLAFTNAVQSYKA